MTPLTKDAAEIDEVKPVIGADRVVAEMRIAVDGAVEIKRHVPGAEHVGGDLVARYRRIFHDVEQLVALDPRHGEKAPGREIGDHLGHAHPLLLGEHAPIESDMARLALVVELLAQPVGDLGMDLAGRDGAGVALVKAHDQLQLAEIGLDRRLHVGILQLAGQRPPVRRDCAVNLAERGGTRRLALEALEALLPIRAELARHAALDEGPAHRRRVGLELHKLVDVFLGQRVGDRGE